MNDRKDYKSFIQFRREELKVRAERRKNYAPIINVWASSPSLASSLISEVEKQKIKKNSYKVDVSKCLGKDRNGSKKKEKKNKKGKKSILIQNKHKKTKNILTKKENLKNQIGISKKQSISEEKTVGPQFPEKKEKKKQY